ASGRNSGSKSAIASTRRTDSSPARRVGSPSWHYENGSSARQPVCRSTTIERRLRSERPRRKEAPGERHPLAGALEREPAASRRRARGLVGLNRLRRRHRHRLKIGAKGTAREEHGRLRARIRREAWCPDRERRARPIALDDVLGLVVTDYALNGKRSGTRI